MSEKNKKNKKIEKIKNPFEDYGNSSFKIKDSEFSITKLSPMDGYKMTEFIRVNLVKSANSLETSDNSKEGQAVLFFKAILGMDEKVVEHIRQILFSEIEFKTPEVELGWVPLKDSIDMAFRNFEAINVYEVLLRSLYVNFTGSFSEIGSHFPGMEKIINSLNQKT